MQARTPPAQACISLAISIGLAIMLLGCSRPAPKPVRPAPTDAEIRALPLAIVASQIGQFKKGSSWTLRVDATGQTNLSVENVPADRIEKFTVGPNSLSRIREHLLRDKFFLLEDEYGESIPGGHTKTVNVTLGDKWKKEVRLHYGPNGWLATNEKSGEPLRALYTYNVIRGWFSSKAPSLADTYERDNDVIKQLMKYEREQKEQE